MSYTTWRVSSEAGAPVGMTWIMPVSAVRLGVARGTLTTPGIASISCLRLSIRPSGSVEVTIGMVTMRGPLKPSPNLSATTS